MCGIAGIVNLKSGAVSEDVLRAMITAQIHRGPDGQGFLVDGPVGLGHCRLSIIDLSPLGHQPMANEDGSLWIVFNGEIFNYIELKKELSALGHKFKSNTDTEVILCAYREWGAECLQRFNGMWAFAIWDAEKKQIFCSRDRFGIKPFYYFKNDDSLVFGSEIKSLLALDSIKREAEEERVFNYLFYGIEDYDDKTFFKNIKQLSGSHYMIIDLSGTEPKLEIKKWYTFFDRDAIDYSTSVNDEKELINLLQDSVRIRLRSDVPVGSCLSGGLDSSSVVCVVAKLLRGVGSPCQEVFISSFPGETIDESAYAQKVIDVTGCVGNFIYPEIKGLKGNLGKIVWHQEEPFGGFGAYAQWLIMERARAKNVKVMLDGQGGDELFFGYERYYVFYFLDCLLKKGKIIEFAKEFYMAAKNSRLDIKNLVQYFFYFSFFDLRKIRIVFQLKSFLKKDQYDQFANSARNLFRVKDLFSLQRDEIMGRQLSHLLKYEDRNSMAHSVEARLPFLDHRLVEFACRLSPKCKIYGGWTKYILRKAMEGFVPDDIRWRKIKIGFEVTEEKWLAEFYPEIKKIFSNNPVSGRYIDIDYFLKKLEQKKVPVRFLWRAYNLELWMQKFGIKK